VGRYALSDLIDCGTRLLAAKGLDEARGRPLARAQVEVHAFGITTHGLGVLCYLVDRVGAEIAPDAMPTVIRDRGAVVAIDGDARLSVECLLAGRDLARERARQFGVGFVSVLRCGWVGVLGYHLAAVARKGFLAMAWAQMSGWPCVAPFGGREGRLSTSPMALSFPTGDCPVVADFSTAAVSSGKVRRWARTGHRPPEPLLLDARGRATDDPRALDAGGTILPFGGRHYGFRGTALSLWIEALTAAAGGRPANADRKGGQNVHILCLHVDSLAGRACYDNAMKGVLDYVLSSPPAEGADGPVLPGQREWQRLAEARRNGLTLDDNAVAELRKRCEALDVAMPIPAD
jgi:L-lactate dehydrogenase